MTEDTSTNWGSAWVRITAVRRERFVEFDFGLAAADPDGRPIEGDVGDDLCVEMVMPYSAFTEFCAAHQAQMLPGTEEAALAFLALADRNAPDPHKPQPNTR